MNTITFGIGCILANLLVLVSSDGHKLLSENKVTNNGPYNFSFHQLNGFLVMEITLKNIPNPVTKVVLIYTMKPRYYSKEKKQEGVQEIKNGEVKFMVLKSMNDCHNILVDVELHTKEGLCNKSRIAEGRYMYSGGHYDGSGYCVAPKPCEIVVDFNNRCGENFNCYFDETKYICRLYNEKQKNKLLKLYQTYDNGNYEPRNVSFREDYSYLESEESFYKIHTTIKNWNNAKQVCEQEGASLFYPEDSDEVAAVISLRNSKTELVNMYVGISDIEQEGEFKTIDGRPISEIYHEWNYNQPDNYNNNEDCVHITKKGPYNDLPCNIPSGFICKKSLLSPECNIQQNLSSVIGAPLNTSNINTKLTIDLKLFDNNTSVNVVPLRFFRKYKLWSNKIILTKDFVNKYNIVRTLTYSETTEVEFSCQKYNSRSKNAQAFVNLIIKESKIETLNKTQIKRNFKMGDTGSILCCLYYDYKLNNSGKDLQITRFVVNKTLLKYQSDESMSLTPAGSEEQSTTHAKSHDYSWLIYVSAAFIGLSILILALYIISKKGWFKNSQPAEETVEFNNHVAQNQVLYADLEFVNNVNRPRNQNEEESLYVNANRPPKQNEEESHYANIVGVLHPH